LKEWKHFTHQLLFLLHIKHIFNMARQSKTSKNANSVTINEAFKDWLSSFKDVKFQFVTGLILIAFSITLTISYISFFFTGAADKSLLGHSFGDFWDLLTNPEIRVENWTGKIGAYLSDLLVNGLFGIASYTIIFILFITGLRLLGARLLPLRKTILHALVIAIWLSITLGFIFIQSVTDQYLLTGGLHGYYMSNWLITGLGHIGLAVLLLLGLFIYFAVTFEWFIPLVKNSIQPKPKEAVAAVVMGETETQATNPASHLANNQPDEPVLQVTAPLVTDDFFSVVHPTTEEEDDEPVLEEAPVASKISGSEFDFKVNIPSEDQEDEGYVAGGEPMEDYDPTLDLSSYKFPDLDLLPEYQNNSEVSNQELIANKEKIVKTLEDFKISITNITATIGPTVTLYEIIPAPGVRISKIQNLEDDIALSLSALGIRIIAPIPGKGTIGIEVPNSDPMVVSMRSILASKTFQNAKYDLPIAFGKTISNETFVLDLTKAPHMLVAGATGQGKSVGLNAIITSLLYKKHPSQLKFVLVDPKKVELNIYSKIERHFLAKLPDEEDPIITDVQRVVNTLNSLTLEMDSRYDLLKKAHARNIKEYNHKFIKRQLNPEKGHRFLPYIVVIIDEFADLIMTAGKEVELPIARIAQLARAVGIHMIIATQRPSTNIITGVIKANFPTRVAFKVASMIDSRTILDSPGANQLIGRGDMLISQGSEMIRVQCAFVDTPEVEKIVEFIGSQRAYSSALLLPEFSGGGGDGEQSSDIDLSKRDPMFEDAARVVVVNQSGSTSLIQRRFSIGYNRAGRIIDQLEAAGVVGPFEGSKARQVLVQDEVQLERLFDNIR
jgi:S-DNA-T family DNA segregation ATPase FtsK/SpoIIIE